MRFFCDGPSIPDLLLERRDQGRVVFLCGAGVSLKAGMPSFVDLTKKVAECFDPQEGSPLEKAFRPWKENDSGLKIPLDQIFQLLHEEYGRDGVNALVAECLPSIDLNDGGSEQHEIIKRLSSDQMGNPQVVTTNFDRLFEGRVVDDIKAHEPPALPNIGFGTSVEGITYLHGRLQEEGDKHPYILSSADLGKAYLAEGWATAFMRSLLDNYTVVLVGYQAEDPPIRYLLQGLNHDKSSEKSVIYAFDQGVHEEIEAKWRDRGVTAIAYKDPDKDHKLLWQTLDAWADRADDPKAWRSGVIEASIKGPRELTATQRGQVAHTVRSTAGAKLFVDAEPSPPSEWLCVFDVSCRMEKNDSSDAKKFYPIDEYRLDDDIPYDSELGDKKIGVNDDLLKWRLGDSRPTKPYSLGHFAEKLPPRLEYLMCWICKNLDSPITAWWAIRQKKLHPKLIERIRYELWSGKGLCLRSRHIWSLILESKLGSDNNVESPNPWDNLLYRIAKEGWTDGVVRAFEHVAKPRLICLPPIDDIGESRLPVGGWNDLRFSDLADWGWELDFFNRDGSQITIPKEALLQVFRISEGHLIRAAGLLKELSLGTVKIPTCYPKREVNGQKRADDSLFSFFLNLFEDLVVNFPSVARAHTQTWPNNEKYYFRSLSLFALNHSQLFTAEEAAESILGLDQSSFWDRDIRREVLFLIRDRWSNFSEQKKIAIVKRLLCGPDKEEYLTDCDRDQTACLYTKWLVLEGCNIGKVYIGKLGQMIMDLPTWNDEWVAELCDVYDVRDDFDNLDEIFSKIVNLPVDKVVSYLKNRDFSSFSSLVKEHPRRAMAALSCSVRLGDYPRYLWLALIQGWPEDVNPRLLRVFLIRLCKLPEEVIRGASYSIGAWFLKAYKLDKELSWAVFDRLVSGLISEDGKATNRIIRGTCSTYEHAIKGPLGKAMNGLLAGLCSLELECNQSIPEEFKGRIEKLYMAPGEGGGHAVAILTYRICKLYYFDKDWVMENVRPWFDFEHRFAEPAWNGFLRALRLPQAELLIALKPLFLDLFPHVYRWTCRQSLARDRTRFVMKLAVFHSEKPYGLSVKQARRCLRNMKDQDRQNAIVCLINIGQDKEGGWLSHVEPFISKTWPKERKFRTSNLVGYWIFLLEKSGKHFPVILKAVRKFLVPVQGRNLGLSNFFDEDKEKCLATNFSNDVLELLNAVIPERIETTYDKLESILSAIQEADSNLTRDRRYLRLINLSESI